jgi:hypothetical protein
MNTTRIPCLLKGTWGPYFVLEIQDADGRLVYLPAEPSIVSTEGKFSYVQVHLVREEDSRFLVGFKQESFSGDHRIWVRDLIVEDPRNDGEVSLLQREP